MFRNKFLNKKDIKLKFIEEDNNYTGGTVVNVLILKEI